MSEINHKNKDFIITAIEKEIKLFKSYFKQI